MSFSEYISPLVGRLILAWFFLSQAIYYGGQWDATVQLMALKGVPVPPVLLMLSLIVIWLGSLSLILGFQTRHGAVLLFGFTVVVSAAMHNFWVIQDHMARAADYEIFARNMAIAGALLLLVGMGPGPVAIDSIKRGKR
ncbi:MAG: DoxX family protein [Alphaproteobacteria bacterium]|nr:DoxX family protein [Alphaproteobacteria bacterium]MBL6940050.1 DoxX family protein [Alphaproteobacteria bacterium]MBL7098094.1 DoxX family protein [Alphaproteobacteria bacterium]